MALHVELLCGGGPSFQAAKALRKQLVTRDVACRIIHIDRRDEEPKSPQPDTYFFPLLWDPLAVQTLKAQLNGDAASPSILRFGKDRVRQVFESYEPPQAPFDDPVGVQVAFEGVAEGVRQRLFQNLRKARDEGYQLWIAVCAVFEGPTGAGIAWTLQDRLTGWIDRFRGEERGQGAAPAPLTSALLEFVPTLPTVDGKKDSLLQGAVAREQASLEQWPRPWFRFDGGKLALESNKDSDRVCAMTAALLITRMSQMAAEEREQASHSREAEQLFDLPELLRDIRAEKLKPIEVMLRVINLPIREETCRTAGGVLKALGTRRGLSQPSQDTLKEVRRLAQVWREEEPAIGTKTTEYDATQADLAKLDRDFRLLWSAAGVSVGLLLLRVAVMVFSPLAALLGGWELRLWAIVVAAILGMVSLAWVFAESRYRAKVIGLRTKMRRALRDARTAVRKALVQELQYGLPGANRGVYKPWYAKHAFAPDEPAFDKFVANPTPLYTLLLEDKEAPENVTQKLKMHVIDMVRGAAHANEWPLQDGSKFFSLIVVSHPTNLEYLNPFPDWAALQGQLIGTGINADVRITPDEGVRLALFALCLRNPVAPNLVARWYQDYKGVFDSAGLESKLRRNPSGNGLNVQAANGRPRQNRRAPVQPAN
jgi:hypothetical protein